MLRDYLTLDMPTLTIGLLSVASGGDIFTGLHAAFAGLPNGLAVALAIAIALRLSFFLFADGVARRNAAGWARALCLGGVVLVMAASAAGGALPGSTLSPIERMTIDGVIIGLIGVKNASMMRAPADDDRGPGMDAAAPSADAAAPPADAAPAQANGLELVDLLDHYTVEELGGLFLYTPKPEPVGRARLQPWILLLQARKVIKSEPWVVYPDGIRAKVRANYPHLFEDDPARFYIYRLDKTALAKLMAAL